MGKFIPIQSEINKTSSKYLGWLRVSSSSDDRAVRSMAKKTPQLPFSSKNRSPQHYLGILKRIPCKTKAKNFDRHYSENSKGVLSHLLQSNSHFDHPLRFAPNWFDDVMMTMCNRTIVKIGFSQLFTMAKHAKSSKTKCKPMWWLPGKMSRQLGKVCPPFCHWA